MGETLKENTPVATEIWLAKKARHAEIMRSPDKKEYEKRIIEYFNKVV